MIVKMGKVTNQNLLEFEGLSTDDKDSLLTSFTDDNVGSSFFEVDTTKVFKLNKDNTGYKWYEI